MLEKQFTTFGNKAIFGDKYNFVPRRPCVSSTWPVTASVVVMSGGSAQVITVTPSARFLRHRCGLRALDLGLAGRFAMYSPKVQSSLLPSLLLSLGECAITIHSCIFLNPLGQAITMGVGTVFVACRASMSDFTIAACRNSTSSRALSQRVSWNAIYKTIQQDCI